MRAAYLAPFVSIAVLITVPAFGGSASLTLLTTQTAADVTVDEFGRTLVLTGSNSGNGGQFIYEDGLYDFIGNARVRSMSVDGTAVAGTYRNSDSIEEAARWTSLGGFEGLGSLPNALSCPSISSGYGITADGSTVCGLSWDGCNGRGFIWTEADGMQELEVVGDGRNRATAISADGSTIVGFGQGDFSRSAAAWNADGTALLFDGSNGGELEGLTPDGNLLVGIYASKATYWTECEGFVELGSLDPNEGARARGVSADARTIVGSSGSLLSGGFTAFVWTPERGMESLQDRLVGLGVEVPAGVTLEIANAVTDDGSTVVGQAFFADAKKGVFENRAFIATLPDAEPSCPADLNRDGAVGFADLTALLNKWGPCVCSGPAACLEDLDVDGSVGFSDLTTLLNAWGPCV